MNQSDLLVRLNQLRELSLALSRERDTTRLLESILLAAKELANADGGTLYRRHGDFLTFEIMANDTLKLRRGGTSGKPIDLPPIPLYTTDGRTNDNLVVAFSVLHDQTVNLADAYATDDRFDFSGTRRFDALNGYRSTSFLSVPMKNHEGDIIGVLQLINARDPDTGIVVPFGHDDQIFTEALASQAAIALTNRLLIEQLENLFESFIRLINTAIDEKSPYTGGHCARVPELTMMLTQAAMRHPMGSLSGFQLGEREQHELRIAAMLHDCGKITTPVHVVDKATKLETIHDRIHEVDARFEILRRDAEIRLLKTLANETDPDARARAESRWRDECAALESERAFLHRSNTGGEYMRPDDQQRVRDIACRSWTGADGAVHPLLDSNEVENLTVAKGTLTDAEREIINYHIVATIKMLEALPWPRHLARVAEYAGAHHERVDGKGYPRGLTREQMSIPARAMAIADIFEALTAHDRPYKLGKTLSEALVILGRMAEEGHVDPELFRVFVAEKVYLEYAENFLDPAQIDTVDPDRLPGYAAPTEKP